jgi:hypothetical protein
MAGPTAQRSGPASSQTISSPTATGPDYLGYGGTSKPLDEKEYDFRAMGADVVEILDTEKLATVACLAHD